MYLLCVENNTRLVYPARVIDDWNAFDILFSCRFHIFPAISLSLNFDNMGLIMQVLNAQEIEMTSGGVSIYDAMTGGALSRAMSGAGAAFGEGLAMGLEAGSFLGPAGAVIGAAVGAGIAYYLLTP